MLATLVTLALTLGALAAAALGRVANFLGSSSLTLCSLLVATVVAAAGAKAESGDSKRNDKLLHF